MFSLLLTDFTNVIIASEDTKSQVLVTKMLLLPVYDMPDMVLNNIAVSLSKTKSTPGLKTQIRSHCSPLAQRT